jgi:hypothetical protein
LIVQARKDHAAAAFQSPSMIVHIGDEMFQCAEEKRTEPSLFAVGARVRTSLDQISEKAPGSDPAHPRRHILVCVGRNRAGANKFVAELPASRTIDQRVEANDS